MNVTILQNCTHHCTFCFFVDLLYQLLARQRITDVSPIKKLVLFLLQTASLWSGNPFYHHTNQTHHLSNEKVASLLVNRSESHVDVYLSYKNLGHSVVDFQAIYRFIFRAKIFSANQNKTANEVGGVWGVHTNPDIFKTAYFLLHESASVLSTRNQNRIVLKQWFMAPSTSNRIKE